MTRLNASNGGYLTRKITIRLDDKRIEELEDYARKEGVHRSTVVRHLVCRFLEAQKRLTPPGDKP